MERIRRQYRQINKKNLGSRIATKQPYNTYRYLCIYEQKHKSWQKKRKGESRFLYLCLIMIYGFCFKELFGRESFSYESYVFFHFGEDRKYC